jgi:hypothetical protein
MQTLSLLKATALLKGHLHILQDRERQVTGTPFLHSNDRVWPGRAAGGRYRRSLAHRDLLQSLLSISYGDPKSR